MNKLVNIVGPNGSGKTTISFLLAKKLEQLGFSCIIVNFDMSNPLHYLVNNNDKYTSSLGYILTKDTPASETDVLASLIPLSSNVSYLSYLATDTFSKYANILNERLVFLFDILKNLADFVIADNISNFHDITTYVSFLNSDMCLKVYNPNLKSLAYNNTLIMNNFNTIKDNHEIIVWNKVLEEHDLLSLSNSIKVDTYFEIPFHENILKNENKLFSDLYFKGHIFDKFLLNLNKLTYQAFDLKEKVDIEN